MMGFRIEKEGQGFFSVPPEAEVLDEFMGSFLPDSRVNVFTLEEYKSKLENLAWYEDLPWVDFAVNLRGEMKRFGFKMVVREGTTETELYQAGVRQSDYDFF